MIYGLLIHPYIFPSEIPGRRNSLSVEILVLISILFNCFYLLFKGFDWKTIQKNIVEKVTETIPIILILIGIGALIGSWVISGTIPMLTYYGLDIVNQNYLYLTTFLICSVFSILTGTSWGTLGTIGVVMISIATVFDLNLAITAGAIISGSLFGDKLSPLSDTTNIVALAAEVDLFDHVKSMLYSVLPSAIIAAILFWMLSPTVSDPNANFQAIANVKYDLETLFNFNFILLLPVIVVVFGAIKRYPIFLVLCTGSVLGIILALLFQNFDAKVIFETAKSGFSNNFIDKDIALKSNITKILSVGGITSLVAPILVAILFFALIGTLNVVGIVEEVAERLTSKLKRRSTTIIASIVGTTFFHGMVTSMYATIFLTSETFKEKYKKMGISQRVLSRSIEDGGTLISPLVPWTPTSLFMTTTLGVTLSEFAPYHFLAYINYIIAIFFAITGIACFYKSK